MALDFLKTALVTLLVTLDPAGLAPLFIGLTLGMTRAAKLEVALRASIIAFVILAAFALGGRFVLGALGVTIPAFRIAGGLLLFYIAFDMLFALKAERRSEIVTDAMAIDHIRNVAAFPLAIPLMAGPGSITATMLLAERASGDWLTLAGLMAIVALAMAVSFVALVAAERLSGLLGATGRVVLTRMLGVVLAALAVQFALDGAAQAWRTSLTPL
jgi:multiple antibiotic resistance protein